MRPPLPLLPPPPRPGAPYNDLAEAVERARPVITTGRLRRTPGLVADDGWSRPPCWVDDAEAWGRAVEEVARLLGERVRR
jgi:hypothetical protein